MATRIMFLFNLSERTKDADSFKTPMIENYSEVIHSDQGRALGECTSNIFEIGAKEPALPAPSPMTETPFVIAIFTMKHKFGAS